MKYVSEDFNNPDKVRVWYEGIQLIFKHIQESNNWSKQEAQNELKIELIHSVGKNLLFQMILIG